MDGPTHRTFLRVVGGSTVEHYCLEGFDFLPIGRGSEARIRVDSNRCSRVHAILSRAPGGRWNLVDSGSSSGTWLVNDKVVPRRGERLVAQYQLEPGDVFTLNFEHQFHFLLEPIDQQWEALAAGLAAGDGSEASWRVFADQLEERGHPLGPRMAAAGSSPLLPLGFLRRYRDEGTVTLRFRMGFVHELGVANVGLDERTFDAVLSQPLVRLAHRLDVDLRTFEGVPLPTILEAIRRSAPPGLRVVRLNGLLTRRPAQVLPGITIEGG